MRFCRRRGESLASQGACVWPRSIAYTARATHAPHALPPPRRKQQQVAQRLGELGEEALEERLQLAGESAGSHRLAQAIQVRTAG